MVDNCLGIAEEVVDGISFIVLEDTGVLESLPQVAK